MAVSGIILDKFINKQVNLVIKDNNSVITGFLTKKDKRYYLNDERLVINQIAAVKNHTANLLKGANENE